MFENIKPRRGYETSHDRKGNPKQVVTQCVPVCVCVLDWSVTFSHVQLEHDYVQSEQDVNEDFFEEQCGGEKQG